MQNTKKILSKKELLKEIYDLRTNQDFYIDIPEIQLTEFIKILKNKNISFNRKEFKIWSLTPSLLSENRILVYFRLITLILSVFFIIYTGYKIGNYFFSHTQRLNNYFQENIIIAELSGAVLFFLIISFFKYIIKKKYNISIKDYLKISQYQEIWKNKKNNE